MIQTEGNFKQLSMPFQFNYIYDNKVVKAIIDWQNEIREIEFDFVKYLDKKNIKKPDLKILNEFYSNNKDSYIFPKTRDIKYIEIKPSDFHNEVKITKKTRKFILESKTLVGTIKTGNFHTNDNVYIVSGNTKISGTGLDLRKNGEYVKVKGKAILTMLVSSKNEE